MQSELETYKNMLSERETELKIMKRERDEYLTAKVEITLDYKKIKVSLVIYLQIVINEYLYRMNLRYIRNILKL